MQYFFRKTNKNPHKNVCGFLFVRCSLFIKRFKSYYFSSIRKQSFYLHNQQVHQLKDEFVPLCHDHEL